MTSEENNVYPSKADDDRSNADASSPPISKSNEEPLSDDTSNGLPVEVLPIVDYGDESTGGGAVKSRRLENENVGVMDERGLNADSSAVLVNESPQLPIGNKTIDYQGQNREDLFRPCNVEVSKDEHIVPPSDQNYHNNANPDCVPATFVVDDFETKVSTTQTSKPGSCSDISESSLSADASSTRELSDDAGGGGDREMHEVPSANFYSASETRATRSSFTICSAITNSSMSDHGSIRSQRENIDRLLLSSSTDEAVAGMGGSHVSSSAVPNEGRPRSNSRGCMESNIGPSVAHTYDQEYYRNGDWLRFLPRRSSSSQADHSSRSPSNSAFRGTANVSEQDSISSYGASYEGSIGGTSMTPDNYYRGFDNTRIRFAASRNSRLSMVPHVPTIDEEENGRRSPTPRDIMTEEPGTDLEVNSFHNGMDQTREDVCSRHCIVIDGGPEYYNEQELCVSAHGSPGNIVASQQTLQIGDPRRDHEALDNETGKQFESSLRVGSITNPPPDEIVLNAGMAPTTPSLTAERRMHEGSWDSKYETYACCVDQSQGDRAAEIPIFSLNRPHMRAFHVAWLSFFMAFLAWFSITPLLSEVQRSLGITKADIWTSSIFSVAGAVVFRCISGLLCDVYGARWVNAVVLFVCGVPTMFTGLVNSTMDLSILRLVVGIGGSAFVTCQYWTTTMFTKEVAGTANALAAGWGNLGGGVAQILMGTILFPLFKWIYESAGTEKDPAELSWRTVCVFPGLMCASFTFVVIHCSDDSPKGNYRKRKRLGLMQNGPAMKIFKAAISDHNTWVLFIQYGCCFGVELTTSNAAALYFKEEFELSTEAAAAVASTFGWMNLFARGLGGFLSDISNAYSGMRGRLWWQLICFALEGVFVVIFSKATTLAGAIFAMIILSLFVQGAEGSTFGIVPYLNPSVPGTVAGIVGAGGNMGAVLHSVLFRQLEYRAAFFYMGVITIGVSVLSSLVWIRGYQGLILHQRPLNVNMERKGGSDTTPTLPPFERSKDATNPPSDEDVAGAEVRVSEQS